MNFNLDWIKPIRPKMMRKKVRLFQEFTNPIEHQEFLKKRKEHYKNEMLSAKMLLRQSQDEDDEQ